MTVIPFPTRSSAATPASPSIDVSGSFDAPGGGRGHFTGTYRLESSASGPRGLTTVGVFAGVLADENGRRVGLGARRHRGTARAAAGDRWCLDAAVVDLLGLSVTMEPVHLRPDATRAPVPATGAGR